MTKPILCLDFDGVIHSYSSGWKGAGVIPDEPVPGAAEFIEEASKHFNIAIFSSRSRSLFGRFAMKRYMRKLLGDRTPADAFHSGDFLWEDIQYPWFKPSAAVTLDDRAITFSGVWPAIAELRSFQPWNKR